ncbi:VOC family protein [bacterium (Candidatus Blackallbacteria) CG17_big_fil_post_rev_8_21_14_2_50_48_46]|uniref:VOC family protein n=1 Tax=bacterium (Candidatus Blackallbacteria) CG17_big_fil_post_rev_8_21_14_2_50_48_46 TaxID=2014261 RepID=A0A2M7G1Y8_9BACT|nr:MAG: VOC family protein [bacterium (Candidatus Blackallbacteria) CG18_big_fil_WC_8_21_14_2_50_49_26]PIW15575.1 MAG: VOC family protein [bacterium (Candidatus Blackallbacteria) CG17_big_fil_post_rev_8_21_14_2_50_48_46]PIW49366.1 MAG: VOC family protein [bacterium (Candidatus Blackallbacteria) CG13_big_fil_rev_8_21_14_2_50_49_14]
MASVSTYLNFSNHTEEVFKFYQSIFGGEFTSLHRFSDIPNLPNADQMSEADKNGIMHIELPILGGHRLMGTDAPESMGFKLSSGNNVHLSLEPDSREEADRLFQALSEGGKIEIPLQDMFWGAYFGSCVDKYGIHWMLNFPNGNE